MIDKFITYIKYQKKYSDYTILNYNNDLNSLKEFLDLPIEKAEYSDLRRYLVYLNEKNYSSATISRHVSCLKSFYKFLYTNNYINSNPTTLLPIPKKEKKLPNYIHYNDFEKLICSIDESRQMGLRNLLIFELLYATGIRVSELVNIKINDISDNKIKVLGKGKKERYVIFGEYSKEVLEKYLHKRNSDISPYLFLNKNGMKLTERGIRYIILNTIQKSSLKLKVSPHTLRHTFATHMLNEGADLMSVSKLLGHENLSSTQIYTHITNDRLRNIYYKNHPRAK